MNEPGLNQVHAAFNISQRAADHLSILHDEWKARHEIPRDDFIKSKHVLFFKQTLQGLPEEGASADETRLISSTC